MIEPVVRLASGGARLAIDLERGGRIASWSVDGRELLVGPPTPDDRSIRWGCFLMAPWAGRLADGRFRAEDGRLVQLPRTHGRHAIHGLLWDRPWTVAEASPDRAVLTCEVPADLWPPGCSVRHEVRLTGDRLELVATVTASSAGPTGSAAAPAKPGAAGMPVAVGWHPWFRRDGGRSDTSGDVTLRVDASRVLRTDRMISTGETTPVLGRTDLRRSPRLGRRRLDHAYVAARSPAVLCWQDLELTIAWDPTPATLVVHTPASSLSVEPQTAWPNAPALDGHVRERSGLRILPPGQSLTASMSMAIRGLGGVR
jgi:galactose mutarotase-like enzyme